MIGIWSNHAQTFLLVFSALVTLIFALPLFFAPLAWGRLFLWTVPDDTDLTVYFGRGAGAFLLTFLIFTFRAGLTGEGLVLMFQFLVVLFVFMLIMHIYGAIRKIQPITETLEIGMYTVLLLLALAFFPIGG